MTLVFWLSLFVVFYTFIGYGILLYIIIRIKRRIKGSNPIITPIPRLLPGCTLVIAAFNEEAFIEDKIKNCLSLKYPAGKLKILFVTDGSTDRTLSIIEGYPQVKLIHEDIRGGKIAAIHRAMTFVDTDVVVFTDANTFLNPEALTNICRHYIDKTVGAVAGEKRVMVDEHADASSAGEGFYWKYESALKKWDSELYSVVGAAGELFSVRRSLYEDVPADTVLDDFMISMLIAAKGYRIVYEPQAYAMESGSENVSEELKRKIRIAAGGMQSILRLKSLFNPFNYPVLSFQYVSHRVLRWTVTPFLLLLVFILNLVLALAPGELVFKVIFFAQVFFYGLALAGMIMEKRKVRIKALFVPYYFCVMNYAVMMGIFRYFGKKQSAVWERAQRKQVAA
jgi:biofilm PGA synthesis N-glycosyltransferase PgaC